MEVASQIAEQFIEKRGFPRLKLKVPLQFRNILKPQEPFAGSLSQDVSASGARISSSSFLPKEARLVLLLSLPGTLKPIRAIGRVVWMQQQRLSEGYDGGIQFVEITPEDQGIIASTIERGVVTQTPRVSR